MITRLTVAADPLAMAAVLALAAIRRREAFRIDFDTRLTGQHTGPRHNEDEH